MSSVPPIATPCRRICRLGSDGLCDGCGRSLQEIGAWLLLDDDQRREVLARVAEWEPRAPAAQ